MIPTIEEITEAIDVAQRAEDAVADILDGAPLAAGIVFICSIFEWISEGEDRAEILERIVKSITYVLDFDFTYPPKEE